MLDVNAFGYFPGNCLKIYEPDPDYFISARGLAWEAGLEKSKAKLELLTYINTLFLILI